MLSHQQREFRQNAAFLVAFLELQFAHFVVGFHDGDRLDEERRAAGTLVVDDGLDAPLEFRAQGEDVTPVALGDDGFLQHGGGARVGDVFLQARHQAVMRGADLAPQG